MDREETIKAIAVMQAWVDGKQLEGRWKGEKDLPWQDFEPGQGCMWAWTDWEYRLKRRVIWVNEYENLSNAYPYPTKGEADAAATNARTSCTKFIEVLD